MYISLMKDVEIPTNYSSFLLAVPTTILVAIAARILLLKWVEREAEEKIPGKLGFIPFLGETFSFLAATNSTKGCYDFVRQRRLR